MDRITRGVAFGKNARDAKSEIPLTFDAQLKILNVERF
jgi:hypothetical protein